MRTWCDSEKMTLAGMARYLRIKQWKLLEMVRDGIVPCIQHQSGLLFYKEQVLKAIDYKPRTRKLVAAPPKRDPQVFFYARASHRLNSDTDSVPAQIDRALAFAKQHPVLSTMERGMIIQDLRTSAYKVPLFKREGGRKLGELLRRGDHLVVDKLDRLCRNIRNFLEVTDIFEREGIIVHFVDLRGDSFDTSSAIGKMCMKFLALMAELQSEMTSERIKARKRRDREQGRATGPAGFGLKTIRSSHGVKRYAWNPYERMLAGEIIRLHDEERLNFEQIAEWFNDRVLSKDNAIRKNWSRRAYPWSRSIMRDLYIREKNWRINRISEPRYVSRYDMEQAGLWKGYRELRHIPAPPRLGCPDFDYENPNVPFSNCKEDRENARKHESSQTVREVEEAGKVG